METTWPQLAIKDVQVTINNGNGDGQLDYRKAHLKVGAKLNVRALVKLGSVIPDDVSVELYHGSVDPWGDIEDGSATKMEHDKTSSNNGDYWFSGLVSCSNSGRQGFVVRILPRHADLVNPYDLSLVLWESPNTISNPNPN